MRTILDGSELEIINLGFRILRNGRLKPRNKKKISRVRKISKRTSRNLSQLVRPVLTSLKKNTEEKRTRGSRKRVKRWIRIGIDARLNKKRRLG